METTNLRTLLSFCQTYAGTPHTLAPDLVLGAIDEYEALKRKCPERQVCPVCKGEGNLTPYVSTITCSTCGGTGYITL